MNILITGSNGQLGSELKDLENNYPEHTFFNTDINELDITNKENIETFIKENNIECIINCAAYTAVDKAEENKDLCKLLNEIAPTYLAEAIEKNNGWMIHISTDYVFGGLSDSYYINEIHNVPYRETDMTIPCGTYGLTKRNGENNIMKVCSKSIIIRTAWLYSTYGNNFVKTMINLGKTRDKLNVVFDQIGTPTYAYDLAKTILEIIDKGMISGIYHFSNEGVTSWYDFTKMIHRLSNINNCKVYPIHTSEYKTLARRPQYSVLDKTKIKETYHIEIPYWIDSLEKCISKLNIQK